MSKCLVNNANLDEEFWMPEHNFWQAVRRAEEAGFAFGYEDFEGTGFGCLYVTSKSVNHLGRILNDDETKKNSDWAQGLSEWCKKCQRGWHVLV